MKPVAAALVAAAVTLPSSAFAGVCTSGHPAPYWTFPYYVCGYSAGPNPPSYYVPSPDTEGQGFEPDPVSNISCSSLPYENTVSCAGASGSSTSSVQVAGPSDLSAIPSQALMAGVQFGGITKAILAAGAAGIAILLALVAVMYVRTIVRGGNDKKLVTDKQRESWDRRRFDRSIFGSKYAAYHSVDDYESAFRSSRKREKEDAAFDREGRSDSRERRDVSSRSDEGY